MFFSALIVLLCILFNVLADVPPTTTPDGTKSDWSPSTEDESQSSKSSSSDESDSEMLVSKVEESDPRINSC